MLVGKNVLSLMVELGLVALCGVSHSHVVELCILIHVCMPLSAGTSNSERDESFMTDRVFPLEKNS